MSRGPRPQAQAAYREEPREAGFYVRPVGFTADKEDGGRAACRIARVKIDQTFDEGSGFQYEQLKMDDMPELVSSDDEDVGEERMTTRAQVALRTKEEGRRADSHVSRLIRPSMKARDFNTNN